MSETPTRRAVLLGLAAAALATLAGPAAARGAQRFAVADWALFETALTLGLVPAAAPELRLFARLAVEPAVPASVADLGLRGAMNFERLALIAPEVIYASNFGGYALPILERIAPLRMFTLYEAGIPPYPRLEAATLSMAADFGIAETGARRVAEAEAELALRRQALAGFSRPIYLVDIGDARHVRAFGADSLFGDVLVRLGLRNAWTAETRYSATAPVGIEALAEDPDAVIVVMGPIPPAAERALPESALWQALPAVRSGRSLVLASCNAFGALPAALRFARLLGQGLATVGERP